jgi:hypothetical protein
MPAAIGSSISQTLRAPAFDLGRTRGHADHHFGGLLEPAAALRLGDEMLDHLLGDFNVGHDPVAQRSDGADIVGRLAEHQLGIVPDCADPLRPVDRLQRDDGRFRQDDALPANVDDGVGRTQVDSQVRRGEPEKIHHCQENPPEEAYASALDALRRPVAPVLL